MRIQSIGESLAERASLLLRKLAELLSPPSCPLWVSAPGRKQAPFLLSLAVLRYRAHAVKLEEAQSGICYPFSAFFLSLLTGLCIFELPLLVCTHRDNYNLRFTRNIQKCGSHVACKTPLYKKILQILILSFPIMNFR